MKTKISKILGVGLALLMVCGLAFAVTPADKTKAEAYLPNMWNAMVTPTVAGFVINNTTEILDYAVGPDGKTIYAVGWDAATATGDFIAKSLNGGKTWVYLTQPAVLAHIAPFKLVAVAPDDPNCVAIVDSSGVGAEIVWYSKNGGAQWFNLGVPAIGAEFIQDIDVSMVRSSSLLLRDIVVGTATGAGAGRCHLNSGSAWTDLTTWAGLNSIPSYDYYAVKFEPNWVRGMSIVGLGFAGAPTACPHNVVYRCAPWSPGLAQTIADTLITATAFLPAVTPSAVLMGLASFASIALPADFDSTSPLATSSYVSWSCVAWAPPPALVTVDDVYRVDFITPRKLGIADSQPIQSLSYVGTISGGTLYAAGEYCIVPAVPLFLPWVWYSTNPQTNSPTWSLTAKPPTGPVTALAVNATRVITIMDPNFVTSNTAFCSTGTVAGAVADDETAFSVTGFLGGLSFNQISFIDTTISTMDDVMPTPDNSAVFLSTTNAAFALQDVSLWRCTTMPPAVGTWVRIGLRWGSAITGPIGVYNIRLSPDYLTDMTLYWYDVISLLDPALDPNTDIQVSNLGGELYSNCVAAAAVVDLTVESKSVVYMTDGVNVYQSTNGAWYFNAPVTAPMTGVATLAMAPTYPEKPVAGNVLVGGIAGEVAISKDGGASFIPLAAGIGAIYGLTQVCADVNWSTNNMVYAGGIGAAGIFRYEVGISNAWEMIGVGIPGTSTSGLATESGQIYAADSGAIVPPAVAPPPFPDAGPWRTVMPFLPDIATIFWDCMNIGCAAAVFNIAPSSLRAAGTDTSTYLWAIDTVAGWGLCCYDDTMCKAVVTPVVSANIPNDPTTGRNLDFVITWNKPSNSLSYSVGIYTDAAGTQLAWAPAAAAGFAVAAVGGPPPIIPGFTPVMPLAPAVNVPNGVLAGGMKYYVLIFVVNQATNDQIKSNPMLANVVSFTIAAGGPISSPYAGPQLLSPSPGAQDVDPACSFSWGPVSLATKYQIIIATDAALTQTIAGTPATVTVPSFGPVTLEYDTDYWYAVKVVEPSESAQAVGGFHTAEAATYTCGICGLVFDSQADLEAHLAAAHAPVEPSTPLYIWIVIAVGAILVIAVIWLIFTTRKP